MTAGSPAQRLPVTAFVSIGLHAAVLWLFIMASKNANQEIERTVTNVDLLIRVHKPVELPPNAPRTAVKPTTWDFLKMALPSVPHAAQLQAMDAQLPEHHATLQALPKLQESRHAALPQQLQALDMNQRRAAALQSAMDLPPEARHANVQSLAQLPALEEVGRRRVPNLPQAIALDESRQRAASLVGLEGMNPNLPRDSRHVAAPVGTPLEDAGGSPAARPSGLMARLAAALPSDPSIDMQQGPAVAVLPEDRPAVKIEPIRHKAQALEAPEKKKAVEIEGPLANRKVTAFEVPQFPQWAKDQGILEADVSIRFWVSPQGDVLEGMRIERSSGYGRIDRLAMESLKNWKFAPIASDEKQWGIITFRFVLE